MDRGDMDFSEISVTREMIEAVLLGITIFEIAVIHLNASSHCV